MLRLPSPGFTKFKHGASSRRLRFDKHNIFVLQKYYQLLDAKFSREGLDGVSDDTHVSASNPVLSLAGKRNTISEQVTNS